MARDMSEQNINIRFVKEVEKHPSLYNFELPEYTRRDISDEAWEEVGRTMNMTPSTCRERWRNLRAVFMRTMRSGPRGSTGRKKPYYLSQSMQFVVPFLRPIIAQEKEKKQENEQCKKKTVQVQIEQIKDEVLEDTSDEDSSEPTTEEEIQVPTTRKRSVQEEQPYQSVKVVKIAQPSPSSSSMMLDSDHIKSFLNSLTPELNEMNSVQFKNFKRRVLLLIDDIMTEIPSTPRRNNDEFIM